MLHPKLKGEMVSGEMVSGGVLRFGRRLQRR
jgi:hypothetical protein